MPKFPPAADNRSPLLDLFKYLAIFAIVLRHASLGAGGTLQGLGADWSFPHAYIAVEFFFVFAGFSLTAHALREPQEDSLCYVLKKWRRYLPVHLICLTILLAAALNFTLEPYWYLKALQDNPDLLLEALMLHRVGATDFILNNPDWFLSALLVACLLVHVLVKMAIKRDALVSYRALALLFSICCYALVIRGHGSLGAYNTPLWGFSDLCLVRALGGVLLGSAVYLYTRQSRPDATEHNVKPALWRATLRELLCLTLFLALLYLPQGGAAADLLSALLFAWIVAVLSRKPQGLLSYLAAWAPLRVLYRTQLALYLCHWLFTHYYSKLSGLYNLVGERTLLNTLLLSLGLALTIEYGRLALIALCHGVIAIFHNSTKSVTTDEWPAAAATITTITAGTAIATGKAAATNVSTTFNAATAVTNADFTAGTDITVAAKVNSNTADAFAVTVEPEVIETTSVGAEPSASASQRAADVLISKFINQANKYLTPPRHDFYLPGSLAVICSVHTALRSLRHHGRRLLTALARLSCYRHPLRLRLLLSRPRLRSHIFPGRLVPWSRSDGPVLHSVMRCCLSARCHFCPGSAGDAGKVARRILHRGFLRRVNALRISSASALFS